MASWPSTVDNQERTRRLLDLFLVSVLLDAGAGTKWQYKSKESGRIYRRSEGLAVASLEMFKSGCFSSDPREPCQVDSAGLKKLDVSIMARGLQVNENNPIDGLEGRTSLLLRLGEALQNQEVFGLEARPGNMLGTLDSPFARSHTDMIRLSALTPHDSSFLGPNHSPTHSLEHPHGKPHTYLACYPDTDRRLPNRRRVAVLGHAIAPYTSVGEHRALPQIDSMADLLAHGSHD